MRKAQNYLDLNHKYLDEAESLIQKGDYVQASEKFWGAAAEMVKAVAAALHQNFYENWLPPEMVIDYGEAVKELVSKLEKAA